MKLPRMSQRNTEQFHHKRKAKNKCIQSKEMKCGERLLQKNNGIMELFKIHQDILVILVNLDSYS